MKQYLSRLLSGPQLFSAAFVFLALFLLLFLGLGDRSLVGSEDRWAEIARNMLHNGDWFHPVINGEVYFDKPLFSYWPIVVTAWITGTLNEFAVRLPSALAALLLLWSNYSLAAHLWNQRVAVLGSWLLATCLGFLFWSHTASADLANVAFVSAACSWYIRHYRRRDLAFYAVFYALCTVGSQMKGLVAGVVIVLAIAPWALRDAAWRSHINLAHVAGLILGLIIMLAPYLVAANTPLPANTVPPESGLTGLDLLIRENLVRYVEPFDHKDPVYSYFYHLPRILLPWSLVFIGALVFFVRRYRQLDQSNRWLLEVVVLVFLFFTVSGSRRWYYLLPIMPFCLDLTAVYLLEMKQPRLQKALSLATAVLIILLALVPVALPGYAWYRDLAIPGGIWPGVLGAILACGLIIFGYRQHRPDIFPDSTLPAALPVAAGILMVASFAFVMPALDQYRQEKPFAVNLSRQLQPADQPLFYKKADTSLVFYLNPDLPVPVVNTRAELQQRLTPDHIPVLIVSRRDLDQATAEFPELATAQSLVAQADSTRLLTARGWFYAYRLSQSTDNPTSD